MFLPGCSGEPGESRSNTQALLAGNLDHNQADTWVAWDAGSERKHLIAKAAHQSPRAVTAEVAQGLLENTSPRARSQLEVLPSHTSRGVMLEKQQCLFLLMVLLESLVQP